jgi:hypothetical protein
VGSGTYLKQWIVRRRVSPSFNATARLLCREAADNFSTIKETVASRYFGEPATRSRSSQQPVIRSLFSYSAVARRSGGVPNIECWSDTCVDGAAGTAAFG